jgi:hypothetical protein
MLPDPARRVRQGLHTLMNGGQQPAKRRRFSAAKRKERSLLRPMHSAIGTIDPLSICTSVSGGASVVGCRLSRAASNTGPARADFMTITYPAQPPVRSSHAGLVESLGKMVMQVGIVDQCGGDRVRAPSNAASSRRGAIVGPRARQDRPRGNAVL